MAITRIHAVKATVNKTIDYICNPSKTKEKLLVSSFATAPETAKYDFEHSLLKVNQPDKNKAFHLIQSFAPGEVSYEEAHKIGIELADKLLGSQHSYVIATHIDKNHCHNHIVFCAANNITHKKYYHNKKNYYHIRELNDQICKEHNLSVVIPVPGNSKSYKEWLENKKGTSWKTRLRNDIDELVKTAKSYEQFIELLKARGYEIKGEVIGDPTAKYISFKPIGSGNFIRGRDKALGPDYTKERIKARIEEYQNELQKKKVPFPKPYRKNPLADYSKKKYIDTTEAKFQDSPGLHQWAEIENLKIAASTYSNMTSMQELKEKIESKSAVAKEARNSVIKMEKELKSMGEILHYAKQYAENEPYHHRYLKSKNPDYYYRTHDMQLVLFDGAENVLKANGIDSKKIDLEKLQSEYDAVYARKEELQRLYKTAEKEVNTMQKDIDKLEQYFGKEYISAKGYQRNESSIS